ncbi:hypothetical protein SH528x_004389 [Novipirellula sp. SH528]|uniref:hypothetical protein n=1 Tax=Novipirellula sp. SH528 TaxID=3454466 RepID=UPI003FA18C5F
MIVTVRSGTRQEFRRKLPVAEVIKTFFVVIKRAETLDAFRYLRFACASLH